MHPSIESNKRVQFAGCVGRISYWPGPYEDVDNILFNVV